MNFEERQALLEEAIEIVRFSDIELGDEIPKEDVDPLQEKVIALLQNLHKERVDFTPKLDVYPLTLEGCQIEDKQLISEIEARMQDREFYKVDIPITLKSAQDWAFSGLACSIAFCPEEEEKKQVHLLPTIHDIFPSDEWQEIFSFQDSLTLGLDENLEFRAGVDQVEGNWKKLSGEAKAKVGGELGGSIKLVFGPFAYQVRKAMIKCRGRGNIEAFWDLQDTQYINEQDLRLSIILTVPKSRRKPINAVGALEVRHDFQVWSADVLKFKQFFSGAMNKFIEGGALIQETETWRNIIHV